MGATKGVSMNTKKLQKLAHPVNSYEQRVSWLDKRDLLGPVLKLARVHHVTLEELLGRSRAAHIVRARHSAWKWLKEAEGWSYVSIAEAWGVDHTTVMAALTKPSKEGMTK